MPITGPELTLNTRRLALRPPRRSDIPDLVHLLADYDVVRYLAQVPYPYARDDGETWVARTQQGWESGVEAVFGVTLRHESVFIGSVSLHGGGEATELGYWLGKAYWCQGYASEAVGAVVAYGFGERAAKMIHATVHPANVGSRRVLTKCGFSYAGDQVCHSPYRDDFPAHRFELTREDWERMHGGD